MYVFISTKTFQTIKSQIVFSFSDIGRVCMKAYRDYFDNGINVGNGKGAQPDNGAELQQAWQGSSCRASRVRPISPEDCRRSFEGNGSSPPRRAPTTPSWAGSARERTYWILFLRTRGPESVKLPDLCVCYKSSKCSKSVVVQLRNVW